LDTKTKLVVACVPSHLGLLNHLVLLGLIGIICTDLVPESILDIKIKCEKNQKIRNQSKLYRKRQPRFNGASCGKEKKWSFRHQNNSSDFSNIAYITSWCFSFLHHLFNSVLDSINHVNLASPFHQCNHADTVWMNSILIVIPSKLNKSNIDYWMPSHLQGILRKPFKV